MDAIEKLGLLSELNGTECGLSHGKEDVISRPAVDFVIIPMGHKESDIIEVVDDYITIPICEECIKDLDSGDWIVLYCASCNKSVWVIKELAKRSYDSTVNLIKECPNCV